VPATTAVLSCAAPEIRSTPAGVDRAIDTRIAPSATPLPEPSIFNCAGSLPASATVGTMGAANTSTVAVENPKVANTASARCAITVALMVSVGGATNWVLVKLLPVIPRVAAIMLVSGVTPTAERVLETDGTTDVSD
jgi:hypothetical protein